MFVHITQFKFTDVSEGLTTSVHKVRSVNQASSKTQTERSIRFLGLLFNPADGGNIFTHNV